MSQDAILIALAIFSQIPFTLWHGWLSWRMHTRSEKNWERMNNLVERERTVSGAFKILEGMAVARGASNPIEKTQSTVALNKTEKH